MKLEKQIVIAWGCNLKSVENEKIFKDKVTPKIKDLLLSINIPFMIHDEDKIIIVAKSSIKSDSHTVNEPLHTTLIESPFSPEKAWEQTIRGHLMQVFGEGFIDSHWSQIKCGWHIMIILSQPKEERSLFSWLKESLLFILEE